jgi:hypothetical protein
MHGPTGIFWANLTPLSRMVQPHLLHFVQHVTYVLEEELISR